MTRTEHTPIKDRVLALRNAVMAMETQTLYVGADQIEAATHMAQLPQADPHRIR